VARCEILKMSSEEGDAETGGYLSRKVVRSVEGVCRS
jgi:hypothetical protein